jgi:alkaline phosphatase D
MNRRTFLRQSTAAGIVALASQRDWHGLAPAIVTAQGQRPLLPQGVAVGDAGESRAIVWSRSDRPARMFVEYSTTSSFRNVRRIPGPTALESSDYTARVALTGLPRGQRIFYRVIFQDLFDIRVFSEPALGAFTTPPTPGTRRDITLAWSADTVGQGWGINPDWGGLRLYETMAGLEPDMFVHVGDTIYADGPLEPVVKLEDGQTWRNIITPAKSKAAETVDDFRGCYKYNLLDERMRRFNASVSQTVLWDDHETRDNWYPTRNLDRDARYQVQDMALLATRARQAFLEFNPLPLDTVNGPIDRSIRYGDRLEVFTLDMRTYRGPNSDNRQSTADQQSAILGPRQLQALKNRLAASRATWKVIASDMPIGLVVPDAPNFYEAVANGERGRPLGRELEIADLLRFIRDRGVRNVVWITGDVHYCAAHYYDPARAAFTEFTPFWEFVAGPLHAGTFGPNELDPTFGPEVRFHGVPPGMQPNRPPSEGLQFFGVMRIDGRTNSLTVRLHDLSGKALYSVELEAT